MTHLSLQYRGGDQFPTLSAFVLIVAPLVLVVALVGCATAPPYNPFDTSKEQFHAKVKRVALTPLTVPRELGISESAKLRFDSLIEAKLQEAGFTTFPAKSWGEVFARVEQEVGGVIDLRTGKLDETKLQTAWTRTVDEIHTKFQFDAVLLPAVVIVEADLTSPDWSKQFSSEAVTSQLGAAFFGAPTTMPALSLVVTIGGRDPKEPAQYKHRAGIQLLKTPVPVTERFSGKSLEPVPVPRGKLLTNDERNRAAVEIALGPLVKKL